MIAETGQIARGAAALFSLALGMGAPLLLVGASGGRLLPKAGPWMVTVKSLFGIAFLGVAAWMLERLLPAWAAFLLYALVAAALVYVLLRVGLRGVSASRWRQVLAGIAALYAGALVVGAASGASDPLHPLARTAGFGTTATAATLEFHRIKSLADLDRELGAAQRQGQRVMLDFYADWCASCKEMDRATFRDPTVGSALRDYRVSPTTMPRTRRCCAASASSGRPPRHSSPPTALNGGTTGWWVSRTRSPSGRTCSPLKRRAKPCPPRCAGWPLVS